MTLSLSLSNSLMGSMLGQQLPEKFKVRYILIIACAVGILCTYAEPAIASRVGGGPGEAGAA